MDLDDPKELRNELSRLYRALEEKDLRLKQTLKQNEKLKSDVDIYSSASSPGQMSGGHAAKKIIELGKKTRSITTELESEKTKVRSLEKEKRDLDKKVSQLASKLAAANIEASAGDAYSMSSFAMNKKTEEALKLSQKLNQELKLELQQAQLEIKNQKKLMELELGVDVVNASQLLGSGFKGRNQQIIALQARVKELERIKAQTQENPSQIKQVKKDYYDFIDKYKKEIKEKENEVAEANKKNAMAKSRSQTLQNQVRILKEQMLALEEKGRHDDELVEALTNRLKTKGKSNDMTVNMTVPPKGSVMKLESIVEIKNLRFQVAQAESRINLQISEIAELRSKLSRSEEENLSLQMASQNATSNLKIISDAGIERDSLEFTSDDHYRVQIQTLTKENAFLQNQITKISDDFDILLNKVYQKRLPSDELIADDLKSIRTILQNQMKFRKLDSENFEKLLSENREAYLSAVQLIQDKTS